MQADGTTPVSGDHSTDANPPSENDYSIGVKFTYGAYNYATAGDSDGEYSSSVNGYTYNDVESLLKTKMGKVETLRANHHGSAHSSSANYVNALDPQMTVISCGTNSFGHPGNRTLNTYRAIAADIYLMNNPCDTTDTTGAAIDYSGTFNHSGTIHLATTGTGGAGYTVDYDAGSRTYVTGAGTGNNGDPTQVKVNEFLMAPSTGGTEWVELYNPLAAPVDVSGFYIDDVAGGGGAPKQIPAGTMIPAGGRYVMDIASGYLNNTGAETVRFLSGTGANEVTYDSYAYNLGSTQTDKVFHRSGDGGTWCATISTNLTQGHAEPRDVPVRARRLAPAVAGGVLVVGVAVVGWHGGNRPPATLDAASTASDSRLVLVSRPRRPRHGRHRPGAGVRRRPRATTGWPRSTTGRSPRSCPPTASGCRCAPWRGPPRSAGSTTSSCGARCDWSARRRPARAPSTATRATAAPWSSYAP